MMAGGYDPNQLIGEDGMPLTQEQLNQMYAQQQNEYGDVNDYGDEMQGGG